MEIEPGKYISKEFKDYINAFVNVDERKDLSKAFNLDMGYERMILAGTKPITEDTKRYFVELKEKAIRNRTYKLKYLNKVHKEIQNIV